MWEGELHLETRTAAVQKMAKLLKDTRKIISQTRQPVCESNQELISNSMMIETYGSGLGVVLGDGVVDVDEDTGLLQKSIQNGVQCKNRRLDSRIRCRLPEWQREDQACRCLRW